MELIIELFKQDFYSLILGVFIVMSGIIAMVSIIGKFSEIIGKPVKWIQNKNSDHNLIIKTIEELNELKKQHETSVEKSIQHDQSIKQDLERVTNMLLNKEIDDWRWEILDMASAISCGRKYSKEQFEHAIAIYERYEKLLEENHLTNGQVDTSITVIKDIYKDKLKNGF